MARPDIVAARDRILAALNQRVLDLIDAEIAATRADKTDWERLHNMTDAEVEAAALADPDAQPVTPETAARMRRAPNRAQRVAARKLRREIDAGLADLEAGRVHEGEAVFDELLRGKS